MNALPTTSCASGPMGTATRVATSIIAFIADLMPKLKGYAMKLDRVTYVE